MREITITSAAQSELCRVESLGNRKLDSLVSRSSGANLTLRRTLLYSSRHGRGLVFAPDGLNELIARGKYI